MPHGPNSIFFTDEGNVLVGNWVDNTATELSLTGDVLTKVKFDEATAINDVRKFNGRYYAIDRTAEGTQVVSDVGERTKTERTTFRFSASDGSANVGEIATADLEGKERALDRSKRQRPDNLTVSPGRPFDAEANLLKVWRGKTLIAEWKAVNPIAETRLLGSLTNGDFYVVVYEMIGSDRILFDHRVLHFNTNGDLIEMARVPQDQYYNVANDAALAADGSVYILMPREKNMDVIRLNFRSELPDVTLPEPKGDLVEPEAEAAAVSLPSTTRAQIETVANNYFTTSTYVPASRVTGTCRVKPSYITGAGNYASVPYSWGGSDLPLDFANKMGGSTIVLAGHAAGYYSSCNVRPAGADCSGAVGQLWKNPAHPFSTSDVLSAGYASVIDWTQLWKGDALNRAGRHIFAYVSGSYGNSFSTWEATADPGTHRMLAWSRSWSDVRNYQPIRYYGLSVTNPTARMSAISTYGVQWENSTGTYQVSPGGSVVFTFDADRSSANAGSIDGWTWKINGTQVRTGVSRFNYTLARGTHDVSLAVTNTNGGISTTWLRIIVKEVQIIVRPTIASYSWTSTPTANVYFGGTVYGTNFVVGGTRLFFCNSSNICYEQPNSLVSVANATRLAVSNVRLARGYWTMFARNAAGDSARSSSFYVQ